MRVNALSGEPERMAIRQTDYLTLSTLPIPFEPQIPHLKNGSSQEVCCEDEIRKLCNGFT